MNPAWSAQLGRNPVLGGLSDAARMRLAAAGAVMTLQPGAPLFHRGDPADAAYLVLSGELEVSLLRDDGESVWLSHLGPGVLVGDMALLDGEGRSASVAAARRTSLLRLGREAFLAEIRRDPAAAMRLLAMVMQRLRDTNALLEQASVLDVAARLALLLLREPRPNTRSQGEIAAMIGTSRESVNRCLARWRALSVTEVAPSGIHVLDPDRLRRLAHAREHT